jgi:hypothetical protein
MMNNVKELTPNEWSDLKRGWGENAASLMGRDGSDTRHANGGHRIKQNPILAEAIKAIRDDYFTALNQLRNLEKQKHAISAHDAYIAQNNIDFDLLVLSRQSFERLQQFNYGLPPVRANEALARAEAKKSKRGISNAYDEPDPLSSTDAEALLRAVVGVSIRSFGKTFAQEGIKYYVPNLSLYIAPEAAGFKRLPPNAPFIQPIPSAHSTGLLPS